MGFLQLKISLFLTFFISAILLNSVGIVILQSVTYYQVTEVQASILEACKDLTIAIVSFAICSFIPRFGYKNAILTGLAIIAIGCITIASIDSFLTTKILFILIGVAFALIKVSVYSTVGLITDNSKAHASLLSLLEGVFQIGVVLCFFVFSVFIHFGNWLETYWLLASLCVIAFILLLFTKLDESAVQIPKASNFLVDTLSMLKLIKLPIVVLFIISVFFYVFIEQGVQSWLPTFNTRVLHLSTSTSVFMASVFALSIAAGRITFGFIMKKIDWKTIIIIGLICCGVLIISTLQLSRLITPTQTDSSIAIIIALLFPMIGFFMAPIYPTLCSSVLSSQPENLQSAMTGLIIIFSALGGTIGSRIISEIFAHFGGVTAFYSVLIPITILVLLILPYAKIHGNK